MSSSSIEPIQLRVQDVSAVIGVSLNSFLIFLIAKKSTPLLGVYKHLMIFISANEVLYSLIGALVSPVIHHTGSTFLVIPRRNLFPPTIQLILIGSYFGLYGSSMAAFGLHFYYRYLILKGSLYLSDIQSWEIFKLLTIPLVYGFTWGLITVVCSGPRDVIDKMITTDLRLGENLSDVTYIGSYFYDAEGGLYWPSIIGILVGFLVLGSSLYAAVHFSFKCHKELRILSGKVSISKKNRHLQRQYYASLIAQTVIPVVLMLIPVLFLFLTVLIPLDIGEYSVIVSMTIAVYPAVDPLPTMLFITPYKRAIIGYARRIKERIVSCVLKKPGTSVLVNKKTTVTRF